jgi:hypothetical protein
MKGIAEILAERPRFSEGQTKQVLAEYEDLIDRAAKLCYPPSIKKRYIRMHGRVEAVFKGEQAEVVLRWLRYAVNRAESEKEWPKGKRFNVELKRAKEARVTAENK